MAMTVSKNPDWAIPPGLSPEGVAAAKAIRTVASRYRLGYTGGTKVFHTPAAWKERGERFGLTSLLVVCHDGAPRDLDQDPRVHAALDRELERLGLYLEGLTSWYSAVYPIARAPLPVAASQDADLLNSGAAAGAVAGALVLGPVGLVVGGLLGGALVGSERGDGQREMTPEEYEGTPDDPNWEREHNEVAAAEAARRVKELAKPLQNDQSVNAADYFDLAERLIGGMDVDAIVPTKPIEERAVAAIWILQPYVNNPHGRDPTDFVDVAARVLRDTEFLRPVSATPASAKEGRKAGASEYHCWVVTQRRPREVSTWSRTRKADALREVREAVRKHRTEGGVLCDDPRKPLEVQFAWKRDGTIEATEF